MASEREDKRIRRLRFPNHLLQRGGDRLTGRSVVEQDGRAGISIVALAHVTQRLTNSFSVRLGIAESEIGIRISVAVDADDDCVQLAALLTFAGQCHGPGGDEALGVHRERGEATRIAGGRQGNLLLGLQTSDRHITDDAAIVIEAQTAESDWRACLDHDLVASATRGIADRTQDKNLVERQVAAAVQGARLGALP